MKVLNLEVMFALAIYPVLSENFVATNEWQEITDDQKIPAGLHYRINLETGKKEAKLLKPGGDEGQNLPVSASPTKDETPTLNPERAEEVRKAMERLKMNRDVDSIRFLVGNFANSSDSGKAAILDDLDYFMHQIDNARDFVTLNGLAEIIEPGLASGRPEIVEKTAILLGSSAQSNEIVQRAVVEKSQVCRILVELLQQHSMEHNSSVVKRLIFALSAVARGNKANVEHLRTLGAYKVLLKVLEGRKGETAVLVKGLAFASEILDEAPHVEDHLSNEWCDLLQQPVMGGTEGVDHVDAVVRIVHGFRRKCSAIIRGQNLGNWLINARQLLLDNSDEAVDFGETIGLIDSLQTGRKEEL